MILTSPVRAGHAFLTCITAVLLGRDDRKYSLFLSVAQTVLSSKHTQQTKAKFDFLAFGRIVSSRWYNLPLTMFVMSMRERFKDFVLMSKNAKCRKQEDVQEC